MAINLKKQIKEASILYSKSSKYFAFYADLLLANGNIRKAEKIVEKNFPAYKEYLTGYLTYAKILMNRERLDEASELLKKALEIDSRCVTAYKFLGDLEIMKTNSHDHLQYYSEVMRYDPCNTDIKNMMHILEKKFDMKSDDDILSRYYSDKDISLPKIPNSEQNISFSEEDEKTIKKLDTIVTRSDKEKNESIIEDIESKMESEDISLNDNSEKDREEKIKEIFQEDIANSNTEGNNDAGTSSQTKTLSKVSIFSSMEGVQLIEENEEVEVKEEVKKEAEDVQVVNSDDDSFIEKSMPSEFENNFRENINFEDEVNDTKIVTKEIEKEVQKEEVVVKDNNKNQHLLNKKDKSYSDFFKSSSFSNTIKKKSKERLEKINGSTEKIDNTKIEKRIPGNRDDSFINRFFDSQLETEVSNYNLSSKSSDRLSNSGLDVLVSSRQGSESRVDFDELKNTIQIEQEQQNDTQVSEEMKEETLKEFHNNKISFSQIPGESEFNSVLDDINITEDGSKIETKKVGNNSTIRHEDNELEEIDLIEENRIEDNNVKVEDRTLHSEEKNDIEEQHYNNTNNKAEVKSEKHSKVLDSNAKDKLSQDEIIITEKNEEKESEETKKDKKSSSPNELSFNENRILRSYDEIDLLEEERVYNQAGDISFKEDDSSDKGSEKVDTSELEYKKNSDSNRPIGILIDDDKNFKKVVVDNVIGDKNIPTRDNKISIVTPTLGEIYSTQGEYQKSKDIYIKLVQKEPNNIEHKVNLYIAEYNIVKARINVELDYYKNLLETHPNNEKYKSRYNNFKTELKKVKTETNKKIDVLKKS